MTIFFPDVSNNNGALDVTGAVALIAKASEGTTFTDAFYPGYRDAAAAQGMPFLAYHYLHNGDPAGQAGHAFSIVRANVPLMLDIEQVSGEPDPTLADVTAFVAAYRALGGRVTVIYLPQWFWSGHWGSPDLRPLAQLGLSLISSNYTAYSDTGPGWAPYGGITPAIWQYTDAEPFAGSAVDFNAYRGDRAGLLAVFEGKATTTTEDDMRYVVRVDDSGGRYLTDGLTYRALYPQADMDNALAMGAILRDTDVTPLAYLGHNLDAATTTPPPAAPVKLDVTLSGTATPAA